MVSGLHLPTQSPCSDSLSLRLPYSVKLASKCKSLTHYTKGTPSPLLQGLSMSPRSSGHSNLFAYTANNLPSPRHQGLTNAFLLPSRPMLCGTSAGSISPGCFHLDVLLLRRSQPSGQQRTPVNRPRIYFIELLFCARQARAKEPRRGKSS